MNKIKEFVTKNKLYVGIGAGVIVALGVTAFLLSGGKDNTKTPETSTVLETTSQVPETTVPDTTTNTTAPETTTEETTTTTEAPTESITVEETTTVAPETTTEAPTTTKAPETTTKKQSSSGNKGEEETERVNDYGNGFYGYDSPRYQVLSTTFEPLNPEWVEVPEMEEVFDFVIKNDVSSNSTWENMMKKDNGVLYPEFKEDIDKLCLAWTKGEATIEDIDNRCMQNVCYMPFLNSYQWMWTYTSMCTEGPLRTGARPTHFVINNYTDYFAEEMQKSREVWNTYYDESSPSYNNGADFGSNICHYEAIENMLNDGYAGQVHCSEYYYLRVYLDKKTDKLHVYYVPFYGGEETASVPLTDEQIAYYASQPENAHYDADYEFLRNIKEHTCTFSALPKFDPYNQ